MKSIRAHAPLLKQLSRCNKRERRKLLVQGGKGLQVCLRECALNVLRGNVPLSKRQFQKLKRYKNDLRHLSKKSTRKTKRIQIEQRGGFLPSLLIPILGSLVGAVVKRVIR